MKLRQVFEILNEEAQEDSDVQLWFSDGDYTWYETDYNSENSNILYLNSKDKPDFNPDLLTSDQVESTRDLWYLENDTWVKFNYYRKESDKEDLYVYLYQDEQPKYHPMQTRIANMLLDKTETKPEFKNTTEATSAYILSDDQNTLKITEPSDLAGSYKAVVSLHGGCGDCAFYAGDFNCPSSYLGSSYCSDDQRNDERDIMWIKQEQPKVEPKQEPKALPETIQETPEPLQDYQPKPHKHKELIKVWLEDTNQKVWYWSKDHSVWGEMLGTPQWDDDMFFAVGNKPTEPPEKMLKFPWGTIEFYAPYDVESDMYAGEVGDHNIFEVRSTLEHYFHSSEHSDLFQKACEEYQINLTKFLKGELNAM